MNAPSFRDIRRPLTNDEILVREKVWRASLQGVGVSLDEFEVKALHESILQTGRELSMLREVVDFQEACR